MRNRLRTRCTAQNRVDNNIYAAKMTKTTLLFYSKFERYLSLRRVFHIAINSWHLLLAALYVKMQALFWRIISSWDVNNIRDAIKHKTAIMVTAFEIDFFSWQTLHFRRKTAARVLTHSRFWHILTAEMATWSISSNAVPLTKIEGLQKSFVHFMLRSIERMIKYARLRVTDGILLKHALLVFITYGKAASVNTVNAICHRSSIIFNCQF